MKKSFLVSVLVLLSLTSTSFAQVAPENFENEEGRMEAAAYNHISSMKKELDSIVKKISDLQNEAGFASKEANDEDDSGDVSPGLVKALGEKLDMTDALRAEFLEVAAEMQRQEGDELFKSYGKADGLMKEARKNLVAAKKLVNK